MRARFKRFLYGRGLPSFNEAWTFSEVMFNIPDETKRYRYFVWLHDKYLPAEIKGHRAYFREDARGFGEDAFHAMWNKLIEEFNPHRLLEIGVYRGQVLSLWSLIAQRFGIPIDAWGVSPLTSVGDSVSSYLQNLDYKRDIERNFEHFKLGSPNLVKGLSQDDDVRHFIKSLEWDLIYIDGSHDVDIVEADVALAQSVLRPGGLLIMDDASLFSSFDPPDFAFRGHPGPSRVAASPDSMGNLTLIGTCGHNRVFQLQP